MQKIITWIAGILLIAGAVGIIPSKSSVAYKPGGREATYVHLNSSASLAQGPTLRGGLTILVLGVAGGDNISPNLTDSILVLRIARNERKATIISLPRDLYVQSKNNTFKKINALYIENGMDILKKKVGEIIGIPIDAYAIVDLAGVKNIIDALGGISLPLEEDFNAYSYRGTRKVFEAQKGFRYFNGDEVLALARYRPDSDFGRIKRQQMIVDAVAKKIFGLNPIFDLSTIINLLGELKTHLTTDLGIQEIKDLYYFGKENNISSDYVVISDDNFLESGSMGIGGAEAYVLYPRAGLENYGEIQSYLHEKF